MSVDGIGSAGGQINLEVRPSPELRIEAGAFYYGRAWDVPRETGGSDFSSTVGFAASASLLFFDPVRFGPFLGVGVGGGSSGGYLFPTFGLEAEGELRFGTTGRIGISGRAFAMPWVPLSPGVTAPVMFGAGFSVAIDTLPVPTHDAPSAERLLNRLRFFASSELGDVGGDAAPPGCQVSFTNEWQRIDAGADDQSCGARNVDAQQCVVWLAVASPEVDIDLRAHGGTSWADSNGLRVQDTAGDAWPVAILCNTGEDRTPIQVEGMRYDRDPRVPARIARWTIALPGHPDAASPEGDPAPVVTEPHQFSASLNAGHTRCLLTQLRESGSEELIELPEGMNEVRVWAPSVSEIEATALGGFEGITHAESLSWADAHVVGFDPSTAASGRRVRVHVGSEGIGGPVFLCGQRAPEQRHPAEGGH